MDIIRLILIFAIIIAIMRLNKPLYISMSFGVLATILLYRIAFKESLNLILKGAISKNSLYLVLAFYTITFLQRMLEKRGHIMLAEKSLNNLFNSRRVNAMVAPFIIGLLPSVGAVLIAAPIVDNAASDYITKEEKAFVTSYFRHISEAFLPTYATIILALNLTGIDMTVFVLGMLPMVVILFLLGYFFYVRKIPKKIGLEKSTNKSRDVKNLVISLWSIALTISIILVLKVPVHWAVLPVILLSIWINKFKLKEITPMFLSAFETRLILTTIVIMSFKEVLTAAEVIERLPSYFEGLPVPPVIIFGLIFFFGNLVAGSQAIIAIGLPLAYATMPNGGLALMIFLMCMSYIAAQVSPTHICLAVVSDHYQISFMDLVNKTMPILVSFILIASLYSYILNIIF